MPVPVQKPIISSIYVGPLVPNWPDLLPRIPQDFRSRKFSFGNFAAGNTTSIAPGSDLSKIALPRLDGTNSALRALGGGNTTPARSILYAATSLTIGAYSLFGLNSPINRADYGWGSHGRGLANRTDFTLGTNIRTRWKPEGDTGNWVPTVNPMEIASLFRGDKVSVIDYGQRKLGSAYRYSPRFKDNSEFGKTLNHTKDFIKFFFTGPKLHNSNLTDIDDIITFRAIITSLSDTFSPSWTPQQMIGRADPNYIYTGYSRDLSVDFVVYATSRDELKPIWRKLNALAGYTTPTYVTNTMIAPWMRITIGDLFRQQPVIIESLSYTMHDSDTTWEINIEGDATNMEVPHKISVSMQLKMISDYLPQTNGSFYTLTGGGSENFDVYGIPKPGSFNWLSGRLRDDVTNDPARRIKRKLTPSAGVGGALEQTKILDK